MSAYQTSSLPIHAWAEEDRPRERLLQRGCRHLSAAELLAIIIGTGTPKHSAVDVSRRLVDSVDNQIDQLGHQSIEVLIRMEGIGKAKAAKIIAAIELGRRIASSNPRCTQKITSSQDAFDVIKPLLSGLKHEEFHILILDRSNKVMKQVKISSGGISGTVVDSRLILKPAIELMASGIILAHNHPSGQMRPSDADIRLTKKICQAAQTMDLAVLDHLIVGNSEFFSFADEGII